MKWTKCTEEMPEPGVTVLLFTWAGDVVQGRLRRETEYTRGTDKRWSTMIGTVYGCNVTHWAPLPPLPVRDRWGKSAP